ncbi:UMP kinase [bacterium]|nr:UMP kinase [bacterium]|tara:strand:- start:990 stop:1682 length:693 start_codon:yes stop_codon:yes gene_type:complete
MRHEFGKTIIIALGGSVIFPEKIDIKFLKEFRALIMSQINRHKRRFIIVTGGGRICRVYQQAAKRVVRVADEDTDWLGIHTTRCNAHLLRTIFRKDANPIVFDKRHRIKGLKYPITIASGWRPGNSTDYIAVRLACDFKVSEIVILGKPKYVYDKDPDKYKGANPIQDMSWKECRKLVPEKWVPGANSPVDPIAARIGEERNVNALVLGKNLKNLKNLLEGRDFQGTLIS